MVSVDLDVYNGFSVIDCYIATDDKDFPEGFP